MEISKDPTISFLSAHTNSGLTTKSQFPNKVFCFDYSPELSLFLIVGSFSTSIPSGRNSGMISYILELLKRKFMLDS